MLSFFMNQFLAFLMNSAGNEYAVFWLGNEREKEERKKKGKAKGKGKGKPRSISFLFKEKKLASFFLKKKRDKENSSLNIAIFISTF